METPLFRAAALLLTALALTAPAGAENTATAGRAMVVSVHPLATEAGLRALRAGGNAVDAAIAVGLTLSVVDGHNSGIGGGCFALIRSPDGKVTVLDGRETGPAAITPEHYLRDGQPDTDISQNGPLASGVPGALAVYAEMARRWGARPLAAPLEEAAKVAADGFPIDRAYAGKIKSNLEKLARYPEIHALLVPGGTPLVEGDTLRQPDLARSLRAIAAEGPGWFYGGPYARAVEAWMAAHGGVLTAADFAGYRCEERAPLRLAYGDYELYGMPPPSSGGLHVFQIMALARHAGLAQHRPGTADYVHLFAEAAKLAFADRAEFLGDPAFTKVPTGLIDPAYLRARAALIDPAKAAPPQAPGAPAHANEEYFGKHTTHFCAADADGWWVSLTATVNTAFGSKVIVPGTGIILNNEMDDFALAPGVANAFGVGGGAANAVAAGKRPLSSMSPTIVTRAGQPVLATGAAGGPTIITQTATTVLGVLDYGDLPEAAMARPRFHHQNTAAGLRVERSLPAAVRAALEALGHKVYDTGNWGASNTILWRDGQFHGAAEPRVPSAAAGL